MSSKQHLGVADYAVLGVSLLIPVLIGIKFRFSGGKQSTTGEYLLAGRNASLFPVIMSITVTTMSAATMLGVPSEVYRFGPQRILFTFSTGFAMFLSSCIFLPVFFRCNVSSIYEFLEMRFGKYTRYTISGVFIIQMVLYSSAVLWGPVLALSAVTDFSTDIMTILCGAVCTFYCFLGGLKAVLWTDAFQCVLMSLCLTAVFVVGIREIGISEIYRRVDSGGRLQFFDFQLDFTSRYTFWNSVSRGLSLGLSFYGANQIQVQRALCMSNCKRAQSALLWSIVSVIVLYSLCIFLGLVLYAVFYLCDPLLIIKETGLTRYDQLVPYFIITRLQSIPGMTGLCFAGIFSGSLSTISSALNSLSTVMIVDFIQPIFGDRLTPKIELFVAKVFCLIFGIICICLTFVVANVDSIAQATSIFVSIAEGPVLAIFVIGVFTRKCSLFGLIVGIVLASWIAFGSLFCGYIYPSLPLESSGCLFNQNITLPFVNSSTTCSDKEHCSTTISMTKDPFILYKISFMWLPTVGFFFTVCSVFLASFLIDKNKDVIPADSNCLTPIIRYWTKSLAIRGSCNPEPNTVVLDERKVNQEPHLEDINKAKFCL